MTTLGEVFSIERDHWQERSAKMHKDANAYETLCSGLAMFTLMMPLMSTVFVMAPIKMNSGTHILLTIGPWAAAILGFEGIQSLEGLTHSSQNLGDDSKKMTEKYNATIRKYDEITLDNPECKVDESIRPLFDKYNSTNPAIYSIISEYLLRESNDVLCNGEVNIPELITA